MVLPMGSPTSTAVKICGLTNIDQARAIAALGVDAIGVIGVANSPRFIKEQQRRDLFAELNNYKPELQRVWVVADINASELSEALQGEGAPSVVQLHGQETPEYCANLRLQHPNTPPEPGNLGSNFSKYRFHRNRQTPVTASPW